MRYEFGDCAVDTDTREIFRARAPVHLSPKAFRLLELLLKHRPRALSKAEIHETIWPEAYVSEATLSSLVAEIRTALGDIGRSTRYLRTVHGFGYAFAAPDTALTTVPNIAEIALVWGDRKIPLSEGENLLGRDRNVGVWINDGSVSRRHARISISGATATLEDLASKNGTYVKGSRVEKPVVLSDGDRIRVGSAEMTFRISTEARSTATLVRLP